MYEHLTLQLTIEDLDLIMHGLNQLPHGRVRALVDRILRQVENQDTKKPVSDRQ